MRQILRTLWLMPLCALFARAQTGPSASVAVHVVVTIGHLYGQTPPMLTRDDLVVRQGVETLQTTNLVPLRGERAGLELFVLVDNCSNCDPGSKTEEFRRFIASLPSTTSIGVAYIQDGQLRILENPTKDRARVLAALNPPSGNKPKSPYAALTQLITGWPSNSSRHAVLMISNGIDPAATEQLDTSASAETAIEAAQRAGVTVFAIYHPSADYATADSGRIYGGQVQLAHVAIETGGEAYFLGFGPLPSLAPFLADVVDHFANQYLLEFLAKPNDATGSLEEISVKSKIDGLDLMVPAKVWVPGRASTGNAPDASRY